ncbi:MAG TPA: LptF/LptG family permease, partial [Candidatus Binatia bacterium]|nr:LptF/LptG family permease [Candidatus Binatia bacterium]
EAGPKEMPLADLLTAIETKQSGGNKAIAERMELHQRISFGFVPLIFCLLGVSLTLLPRTSRANRSWGFMLCTAWLMVYYALLSLGKALGDKSILHPMLALWLPNLVVGGIGLHFLRHAQHELPLLLPGMIDRVVVQAGETLTKFRHRKK